MQCPYLYLMPSFRSICLFLVLLFTQVTAAETPKTIKRLAIVGHETLYMMKMLASAQDFAEQVYFVPMREHVMTGENEPSIPNGVVVYRNADKFKELIAQKPQGIITFQFGYADLLLELPPSERPKFVILGSRTSVTHYEQLPITTQKALSDTTIISFWGSRLKKVDSFHGLGRSTIKILKALHLDNKKHILLMGYGETGKGIADYLQKEGYVVAVYDIDPVESVLAMHHGFKIGSLESLAADAEVVIDATGSTSPILTQTTANYFQQPEVYVLSTSTQDTSIAIENGYKNIHGTHFSIDPSHGMANMAYNIGGNDDESMRVTGYSLLYLAKNFSAIKSQLIPFREGGLVTPSPQLERSIAEGFLKTHLTQQ